MRAMNSAEPTTDRGPSTVDAGSNSEAGTVRKDSSKAADLVDEKTVD